MIHLRVESLSRAWQRLVYSYRLPLWSASRRASKVTRW